MLAVFLVIGVIATLLMGTIGRGEWLYALALFIVANIGVASTLVFYDSLLPHLAGPDELDRVSTAGSP
jgi:UMF1 family MFS transporter